MFQTGFIPRCRLAVGACLVAFGLMAGGNDTFQTFSSPGPDRYADGTAVLPGEAYALVWVRTGHAFAGFDLNGKLLDAENNAFVAAAPLAVTREGPNGVEAYCPATGFQIRAAWAAAHADGEFVLVLLDTRTRGADGRLRPNGTQAHIHAWGVVANARSQAESGRMYGAATRSSLATALSGTAADRASAVPAGVTLPQPRITGVRILGDAMELRAKGTTDLLLYNVSASETPTGPGTGRLAEGGAAQGMPDAETEMTFRVPLGKGRFFRVVRN